MNTSKTISMDVVVWAKIGDVAESDFDGDVSAAVESVCRQGLSMNEVVGTR